MGIEKKEIRSHKWFLTINYKKLDEDMIAKDRKKGEKEIEKASYGILGREIGKKNKVHHLHIWLRYTNARAFSAMKKKFPRARIEVGKGSDHDQDYIKKDGDFFEMGKREAQGKRTDLEIIKEAVCNGENMDSIIDKSSGGYQCIRTAELLMKYKEPERYLKPGELYVEWRYGVAGAGKTKGIFDTEVNIFRPVSYKWWEGYDAHDVVLIDDYRPEYCSFVELLKITDLYPFRVECKGGSRQARFTKLYITSDKHPKEYFEFMGQVEFRQLERRITKLVHFDTEVKG